MEYIINTYIKSIFSVLKPGTVEGYLGDLLGQQLFIHLLLLMVVISLILLFFIILFLLVLTFNKEYIINKFNNKYIKFYIKYQYFILKIALIFFPILFLLGLIQLLIGLHFLITHTIPLDAIPVDPNTYIISKPFKDIT